MLFYRRRESLLAMNNKTNKFLNSRKPRKNKISKLIKDALNKARDCINEEADEILKHKGGSLFIIYKK